MHVTNDKIIKKTERVWRWDPIMLSLAGYHRKNAYMLKHWGAIQGGRPPNDSILLKAERVFFKILFVNPTDYTALDGLGSVLSLQRELEAAEFFFKQAIEYAKRNQIVYTQAIQNLEMVRRLRKAARGNRIFSSVMNWNANVAI